MTLFFTIISITVLVVLSGLFSGLTLGLMGLDPFELERKARLGNSDAEKVYAIRKHGNELLTMLLLCNAGINSALSIFLSSITGGIVAGILATVLIFIFGEVIPQATISRHAIRFGAIMAKPVGWLLFIMKPITKVFSWVLDKIVGDELPNQYSKRELVEIIAEHEHLGGVVDAEEKHIVKHALAFSDKTAYQVMTPRTVVYTVASDTKIDQGFLEKLRQENYSRIPVFQGSIDNIIGILVVKDLIDKHSGVVSDFIHQTIFVTENEKLDTIKELFIQSHQHIAIVRDEFGGFSGIITLEDILEEVIGTEIMDESDEHADMRVFAKNRKIMKQKTTE